jgi:hypothetical protein
MAAASSSSSSSSSIRSQLCAAVLPVHQHHREAHTTVDWQPLRDACVKLFPSEADFIASRDDINEAFLASLPTDLQDAYQSCISLI